MSDSAIIIDNLSKTYHVQERSGDSFGIIKDFFKPKYINVDALKSISIDIKEGEIVAVIGKNGSGKSTLIKHICGILRPDIGNIEVLGM